MRAFAYARPADADGAVAALASRPNAAFVAGGTSLADLMRLDVQAPGMLVDLNTLPLTEIDASPTTLRLGAMARMSDVADDERVRRGYPAIAEALQSSASPMLRNLATIGGNLLQRTRCPYFRDTAMPCNKRENGSGCSALSGENRKHAILGSSEHCIAVHPSDLAVALTALGAVLHVRTVRGLKVVALEDFYRLPGDDPERDHILEHGELIEAVEVPSTALAEHSHYLKVRDRASFEFALVSVAAALDVHAGAIREARIVLGGVAHKPWQARQAERLLLGEAPSRELFAAAGEAAVAGARAAAHNGYKVELAKRTVARALQLVGGLL
jgi:xanthine dehydrogenase YagS FAD-binding subunit